MNNFENIKKREIITGIIFIIIYLSYYYLSGISGIVYLTFSIGIYLIVFYLVSGLFKKIKNKSYSFINKENFLNFTKYFLNRIAILISVLFVTIGSFSYYQNEISPAKIPTYTITNGEKTIVFQAMSHIGSKNFYEKIQNKIRNYKKNGYVYFFEGVTPGSEENQEKFNKALGVDFNSEIYANFSKLYGLTFQDNEKFLGLVNNNDFNIDVSIDKIIEDYEKLKKKKNIENRTYKEPVDINNEIIKTLSELNSKELAVLRYINKSLVNVIIKNEGVQDILATNFQNEELFEIIVNNRNKVVANEIINSEYNNIILTYGLLHFKGIFELLKENDIKWHISRIDYTNVVN